MFKYDRDLDLDDTSYYDHPYYDGADARRSGKSKDSNPYSNGGVDFLSWNDGWNSAVDD